MLSAHFCINFAYLFDLYHTPKTLKFTIVRINCKFFFAVISVWFATMGISSNANNETVPDSVHFRLRYAINSVEIDTSFVDNSSRLTTLGEFLTTLRDDSAITLSGVKFRGTASPDGPYETNVRLNKDRLTSFKKLVNSYITIPDSLIKSNSSNIPWDEFREKVAESDLSHKNEILEIIDEESVLVPYPGNRHIDRRLLKLKALYDGEVWENLKQPILSDLRYGDATFYLNRYQPLSYLSIPSAEYLNLSAPWPPEFGLSLTEYEEVWVPRFYLKTNIIGLALLSANLALEFDLGRHWSFTFPFYYGALDYFKSTVKFRNLSMQPELRYWPRNSENEGFFAGAHFTLSNYNIALGGEYRYQDYHGRHPAIGGGLSIGYRTPISKNKHWHIEFSAGAGILRLDYSKFHNTPDVSDGMWHSRKKKTYIGPDQAAITIAYSVDLMKSHRAVKTKKGGDR